MQQIDFLKISILRTDIYELAHIHDQEMSTSLLFVIVGRNEPLFEAEIHPRTTTTTASSTDAVSRQNYFVLHSALDLVDKAAWNSSQMYLKVVDKVRFNTS